jgi:hypothetical protein
MSTPELPPLPKPAIIGDNVLDGYLDPDAEFTAAQMREYAISAFRAGRLAGLEEAAKVAAEGALTQWMIGGPCARVYDHSAKQIATAIRSLKEKQG